MSPSTVSVHRCRFVDYTPTPITAIAFPPVALTPKKGKGKGTGAASGYGILAIGRANGNVELHEWTGIDRQTQAPQAWVLQKILPGPVPSKIESLVFTLRTGQNGLLGVPHLSILRLFSTGGGSEVLEWDLERGGILRTISSLAGSIWSMAANPASTLLALGCEDGSVRILSLADDQLTHLRRFDRVRSRLLSIAWGPAVLKRATCPKRLHGDNYTSDEGENEEEWVDSWLVAGCSDSSLRKFDFVSGRVLDRMTTDKTRGERTLVWAVGVLADGTIISGDSLGSVKFWDSNTCTQLQSFQAHGADVLCLTIGPEGKSVYTSGVDQKVCQFSHMNVAAPASNLLSSTSRNKWVHTCTRRLHSHDVRAISIWPPYIPIASSGFSATSSADVVPLIVSGGLDMSLVVCPCILPNKNAMDVATVNPLASGSVSTFEDSYYRRLPYSTGRSLALQVAQEAKLLLCRRNTGLTVWKINKSPSLVDNRLADLEAHVNNRVDDWEKTLEMELKTQTNLVASAISSDGKWIAAADLHETKLFSLVLNKGEIRPKRIEILGLLEDLGATSLLFTSGSSKLIIGASMGAPLVFVVDLAVGEGKATCRLLRSFEHHRMQDVVVGGSIGRAMKRLPPTSVDNGEVSRHSGEESPAETDDLKSNPRAASMSAAATITCMAASMDGQWLASADTRHRVHVFNLDSVQHHCALPSFPNAIAALTFDPNSPSTLLIALTNNTLQAFDVEARQFPEWSRVLSQRTSSPFNYLHDPLLGISFDPDHRSTATDGVTRALIWGSSWMCRIKLPAPGGSAKKRRRESRRLSAATAVDISKNNQDGDEEDVRLVTRFRSLLLTEYLGPGELLVVERPLGDLLSTLPPAYYKPRYGS